MSLFLSKSSILNAYQAQFFHWLKRQKSEKNAKNVIFGKSANIRLIYKVNLDIKTIKKKIEMK